MKYHFSQISQNIRLRRTELGLKTTQVAAELGITERAYQNIENGQTDIAYSRLEQLAPILQTSVAALVNYHLHSKTAADTSVPEIVPNVLLLIDQISSNQAKMTEALGKLLDQMRS